MRNVPDPGDPNENLMRRHLQERKDTAWRARNAELERAWQQGRTDPNEASRIEKQRREWHGGR
jgi:hypothetical protein